MEKTYAHVLSLKEENDELRVKIMDRLNTLGARIKLLQDWILWIKRVNVSLRGCKRGRSEKLLIKQRCSRTVVSIDHSKAKSSMKERKTYTAAKKTLEEMKDFLSADMREWDIYRLCILVNRKIQSRSHMIFPEMIRYALTWKPLEGMLTSKEVLRKVILNILLPSDIFDYDFQDRFPFPLCAWKRRFYQSSLDAVATRLKITREDLEEKIRTELLNSHHNLMSLCFDSVSEKICGDASLSTSIFLIADSIEIRP